MVHDQILPFENDICCRCKGVVVFIDVVAARAANGLAKARHDVAALGEAAMQIRGAGVWFGDANARLWIADLILWIRAIRIGTADVVAFTQPGAGVALQSAAALFVAGALHAIANRVAKHARWAIVILSFYGAFSRPSSLATPG